MQTCDCDDQREPHTCPYDEELNGDYETLCTCCTECEQQCIEDV